MAVGVGGARSASGTMFRLYVRLQAVHFTGAANKPHHVGLLMIYPDSHMRFFGACLRRHKVVLHRYYQELGASVMPRPGEAVGTTVAFLLTEAGMDIGTVQKEHARWRAEHSHWLIELEHWKVETSQAIGALRRLADRLAHIEAGLDGMADHAVQHDHEMMHHEEILEQQASTVDDLLAATHARESMAHWRQSVAFDVAKVRHRAIVKMILHMHETVDRLLV